MSSTFYHLSIFSPPRPNSQFSGVVSAPFPLRFKRAIFTMSLEGHNTNSSSTNPENTTRYRADYSNSQQAKHPSTENVKAEESGAIHHVSPPRRSARIHDFCLGIPFGGLIISGHVLEYIFLKNLASLSTGVLYGSSVLALSTFSMKTWKQGGSSFPFILSQAALSAALLWRDVQAYTLTRNLYPSAFYALLSTAMIGFYLYVIISGGNPPPKKNQSATE